jgi:DNA (cytosine-5)-methyltransferase 1
MIGIDLFSGAGGMSLGARWAGVDVKIAVELSSSAAQTYAINHPDTITINGDLQHIKGILSGRIERGPVVLFGGPPCQAFSTSNQRTRGPSNDKNLLYRDFLKLARHLLPKFIVFENVPGILESHSKIYVVDLERALRRLGYTISSGVLNAVEFGVPQNRKRFFLIGVRDGKPIELPSGSSKDPITVNDALHDLPSLTVGADICRLPYRSVAASAYAKKMRGRKAEATGNLVSINAAYVVKRYGYIPQGGNWSDIPSKLMRNYADRTRCHTGIYHRLDPNEPSVVIGNFRKNMLIHPYENRGLSVREAARLQSFPDWYQFCGTIGLQQQQVGNAVPPLLAKAVFKALMANRSAVG